MIDGKWAVKGETAINNWDANDNYWNWREANPKTAEIYDLTDVIRDNFINGLGMITNSNQNILDVFNNHVEDLNDALDNTSREAFQAAMTDADFVKDWHKVTESLKSIGKIGLKMDNLETANERIDEADKSSSNETKLTAIEFRDKFLEFKEQRPYRQEPQDPDWGMKMKAQWEVLQANKDCVVGNSEAAMALRQDLAYNFWVKQNIIV